MANLPARPTSALPPLPPGWTEHKAPSGHLYYYNKETKKSTYTRPVAQTPNYPIAPTTAPPPAPASSSFALGATSGYPSFSAPTAPPTAAQDTRQPQQELENLIFGGAPPPQHQHDGQRYSRGGPRGGFRGGHNNVPERQRQPHDRPKHRADIPNCAPWVLVRTKLNRRFVWNKETNKSFWKFPPDVMKAVVEFDRIEREKKERRERGEPSDVEEDAAGMAEIDAEIAAMEDQVAKEIVEVDGDEDMENDEEYEEVEVTDDEGDDTAQQKPPKRQRTEEPSGDQPAEMGDDDLAWQLAQMEEMEQMQDLEGGAYSNDDDHHHYEDEEPPLTEEDCQTLFHELLDDTHTNPYTPWDQILSSGTLYSDPRYKALPTMKARKDSFATWSKHKIVVLKAEKARQPATSPLVPYLSFLSTHATPKLYWPEFRRKYKKHDAMRNPKLSDKQRESLYRDHIKRLTTLRDSELKSDLSSLLKSQPLAVLNRQTTLDTLPEPVLEDLRYISLPRASRDALIESFISTLPDAPEGAAGAGLSVEEEAERKKKRAERERREKALAERERRVQEEKRRQERDLAYGKGRLREEEREIEQAMKVGKDGLRGYLE